MITYFLKNSIDIHIFKIKKFSVTMWQHVSVLMCNYNSLQLIKVYNVKENITYLLGRKERKVCGLR